MAGSRWHSRICWAVVIAALIILKAVEPHFGSGKAPSVGRHALYVAVISVLAVLLLFVLANQRCRVRLRIRPRLSRLSAHGAAYLEAFALKALLLLAVLAAIPSIVRGSLDWDGYVWVIEACDCLPYVVAIGYACVRARSVRVPFAEWGWRCGPKVLRDLSIGIAAGIVAWWARHVSSPVAGPDAIELRIVVGTVLFTPVLEETLYRGVLYRHLRDRLRWLPATLISATVFAFAHSWHQMPNAYVGGLVYALLREWRGSLIAPVAAHMSMNLLAVAAHGAFS